MNYLNRQHCEAALQEMDEGLESKMKTLFDMALNPETHVAVVSARKATTQSRWQEVNKRGDPTEGERAIINVVWDTLPGYTCFMDAVAIVAMEAEGGTG